MSQPSSLRQIVDRQVSLWGSNQSVQVEGRPSVRGTLKKPTEGPWITISTQLGAGGPELAARLGQRLGWRVIDKEILQEIAKTTHTRERILSHVDGHAVGAFEDYVTHLFAPGHLGRSAYVLEMMRVVWAIAREGEAIMIGRGANWLLDPRYGVRVRAIAPVETRVEWFKRTQGLSAAVAARRVEEDNADRAKFTRQIFKHDIDDALGYDLVVNLGTLEPETVVELVTTALSSKVSMRSSVP
jgi:cytidylate kinase